jgi:radical SAM superfamily enzyme YgiQ (UPF0313 family)
MKVILVRPPSFKMPIIIPNLGLGYLAAVLRNNEHTVHILDCTKIKMNHRKYRDYLIDEKPDIVGIQMYTCDFSSTRRCIDIAKETNRNMVIIAGGPHPSGDPEGTMEISNLDFAFSGEAESGLPRLLQYLESTDRIEIDSIEGLIHRRDGRIIKNKRGYIENPDDIPFPAWDLIDPTTYPAAPHGTFSKSLPIAPIITSRGCPFQCTYCGVRVNTGIKFRRRSIDNVIKEINYLRKKFGVKEFHVEDDNFTLDKARVMAFCNKLKEENISLDWACTNGIRLDTLDKELLQNMESAGCYSFAAGIESGSPKIIADMKRSETLDVMIDKINLISSTTKIRITGFFMIGYPAETIEDIEKTINLALKLPLHRAQFSNFLPLPGTEIYDRLMQSGEIAAGCMQWDLYQNNRVIYCPKDISPKEMRRLMRKAFAKFYFRLPILSGLIGEINSWGQFRTVIRRFIDVFR